ncbi:Rid family hydrolase [Roseococcus pinisoli]|uniref:RidA family protein n=1 Tax=Roseococcus pinisoli TaxID=2835040 RepID=A0ABS5QC93_9PROT|nr:Rid family hydrolase [Roseococcus pinisoli]MBS7811149.1 RidA family protein [Roseococcus pinisoli]
MITRIPGTTATRSRVIVHNGIVTTVTTSPDKTEDMYVQAKGALAAIEKNLADAGSSKAKILTAICYCADMSRKAELNKAWDEWVDTSNVPMRAVLGVSLEGKDLIEIICTAVA